MAELRFEGKVLVGVDGSQQNQAAVAWAIAEAKARDTELVAAYAWHMPALVYYAPGYLPIAADEMAEEGRKFLERTVGERATGAGVKAESRVIEASAHSALSHIADEPDIATVVVGTRGHGAAVGALLGSVTNTLVHHCPKPLVIVHSPEAPVEAAPIRRVVVGVDGSRQADTALRWASDEAKLHGATLEVVTAWSWITTPADMVLDVPVGESLEVAAREILADAVGKLGPLGVEVKSTVREGPAAEVLLAAAEGADLLVVGSRGRGRAAELLLGSTSHLCAHRSRVPVAIIPAETEGHG